MEKILQNIKYSIENLLELQCKGCTRTRATFSIFVYNKSIQGEIL